MISKNTPPPPARPPHPATVILPKRPLQAPAPRPPHPATVALPKALPGPVAQRAPHPATVALLGRVSAIQRMYTTASLVQDELGSVSTEEMSLLSDAMKKDDWSALAELIEKIKKQRKLGSISKGGVVESSDTSVLASLGEEALLSHAYGSSDAKNVVCWVNGKKTGAANADPNDFATLGEKSEEKYTEISVSSSDGEVLLLSAAFAAAKGQGGVVVLCGPYGPCNGCKQRIQRFAELWMKTVKSGTTLVIHYVYASIQDQTRNKIKTVYGDKSDNYKSYAKKQSKEKDTLYIHTWTATA